MLARTVLLTMLWAASAEASSYSLTLLGSLRSDTTGGSSALGITNAGLVVGQCSVDGSDQHAFRWTSSGGMVDAGTLVTPFASVGFDVNSSGQMCGYGATQSSGFATAMHQFPGGSVLALPKPPGAGDSYAYGISDGGVIVGWTNLDIGCGAPACPGNPGHAVRWVDGSIVFLTDLGGSFSAATNISKDGTQLCGYGANVAAQIRAFRLHGPTVDELPPLAGFTESYAQDINNQGDVVGYSRSGTVSRATMWVGTTAINLGLPGGAVSSLAIGMNASGASVGYSILPDGGTRALLFSTSGPPTDLNSLVAPDSAYTLSYADEINDGGQIVGEARRANSVRGMVLTPIPTAAVGLEPARARGLELRAPQPNPLIATATLRYAMPRAGRARLEVVDVAGREVALLLDGDQAAGEHSLAWDASDAAGRRLKPGLYLVRIQACGALRSRKVAVAR